MELTRLPDIPDIIDIPDISDIPSEASANHPADIRTGVYGAIAEIKSYLIRLDRVLSSVLYDLGEENLGAELKNELINAPKAEISSLKDEIVRTAYEIKEFRDNILLTLTNGYLAKSEAGEIAEEAVQRIELDGKGITQYFREISALSGRLEETAGGLDDVGENVARLGGYLKELEHYIRTGKLDEGIYGIEIGNFSDNASTRYKVRLSESRLSFYIGNTEVAYFSDNSMYISNANVSTSLRIGDCLLTSSHGLTLTAL